MTNSSVAEYRNSGRRLQSPGDAPDRSRTPRRRTLLDHIVLALSLLNLAAVLLLVGLLGIVSEDWWFSLVISYLPRAPWVIPSVLLVLAAMLLRRRIVWINLFSMLLVLGPIMGMRVPLSAWASGAEGNPLTVVSYNVLGNSADAAGIFRELIAADPDLIVLQEATLDVTPLRAHFADWHFHHAGEYLVAARWPVKMLDACRPRGFGRACAILCHVDHPDGAFLVGDIHLTTARYGLTRVGPYSPWTGDGIEGLLEHQRLRELEAAGTAEFFAEIDADMPLLIVGDFNMPVTGSLFQQHWGDLRSAFDAAGWGYGYTAPCHTNGSHWPRNIPWLRIDHILLSEHWDALACRVGSSDASDHRCIVARIARR
jgi:vancomycin resistance protein VanJ